MHGGNVWAGGEPRDWLDFSANLRPEGPPGWLREALCRAVEDARYYPDPDMKRAERALAGWLGLPETYVRPTAGGASAIRLAMRLGEGRVLIFDPAFTEYREQAHLLGRQTVSLPLLREGKRTSDLAEIAAGRLRAGDALWLCNPSNPLGCAFPREELLRLLMLAEEKGCWLVADEAFAEYCPGSSLRDLVPAHERLAVVGSMTKILGIPGVRLGYLCAQPQVLRALAPFQLPWELGCFAAAAACALPGHREEVQGWAEENARCRATLCAGLARLGCAVYPSDAPFVLADLGRLAAPVAKALRRRGILVRTCEDFIGLEDGRHLRLAVREEDAVRRLLDALEEVLCAENA